MPSYKNLPGNVTLQNPAQYHQADLGDTGVFIATSAAPFYTTDISATIFSVASATVSGTTATITLTGTPDITEVMEGNMFKATGLTHIKDGYYEILSVTSGSYLFTITVPSGTASQAGAGGTAQIFAFEGAYALVAANNEDAEIAVEEANTFGAANPSPLTIPNGSTLLGNFTEVVVTSGTVRCHLR